jgi:hypothetical protein
LKAHIKVRGRKSEFEYIYEYTSGPKFRALTAAVRFVGIFVGIGRTNVHGEFRYSERGNEQMALKNDGASHA